MSRKRLLLSFFYLFLILITNYNVYSYMSYENFTSTSHQFCEGSLCNVKLFNELTFLKDKNTNQWKSFDTFKSLKNTSFYCNILKNSSLDADVTCIDFNTTWVKLNITFHESGSIPIRTVLNDMEILSNRKNLNINKNQLNKPYIIDVNFPVDSVIHIGKNSTTVTLTPGTNNQEFGCTDIYDDQDHGATTTMKLEHSSDATKYIMCKFDISAYSNSNLTVSSAILSMIHYSNGLDAGESISVCPYVVYNNFTISSHEWCEGNSTASIPASYEIIFSRRPSTSYTMLKSVSDCETIVSGDGNTYNFNFTWGVNHDFSHNNDDFSLMINATKLSGTPGSNDAKSFYTDDTLTANYRPYLTIIYDTSASSCVYSGSGDWTINCADNCNINTAYSLPSNNLIFTGTGNVYFKNTTRVKNIILPRGNSCKVHFKGKLN